MYIVYILKATVFPILCLCCACNRMLVWFQLYIPYRTGHMSYTVLISTEADSESVQHQLEVINVISNISEHVLYINRF